MLLDGVELTIISIYNKICKSTNVLEKQLGFELDKNILNDVIPIKFISSDSVDLSFSEIPGTKILQSKDARKFVSFTYYNNRNTKDRNDNFFYKHTGIDVEINIQLCDSKLFITDVLYYDRQIHSYIEILLMLYRIITGCRMPLFFHKQETLDFMNTIEQSSYTPTTISFVDVLKEITNSHTRNETIVINPKYDGIACWLYWSETTPISLVTQYRTKSGNKHKYVGRLSNFVYNEQNFKCAIFCEMIKQDNSDILLVAIDCFTENSKDYYSRRIMLGNILSNNRFVLSEKYFIKISDSMLLRGNVFRDSTVKNMTKESICNFITSNKNIKESTDGYVLYIGERRPCKFKLATDLTLDIEYTRMLNKDSEKVVNNWTLDNSSLLNKIINNPQPDYDICPEDNKTYVLEVKVCDGTITRNREDRKNGNSKEVINNVINKYKKDAKYSYYEVWSGIDLKIVLLLNRMYKRYCYNKYIPLDSRIIDLGSGNGGDLDIWNDNNYNVLAIELDTERFKVLHSRISNTSKVRGIKTDMVNAINELHKESNKYKYACFMRSITNMETNKIIRLLKDLNMYGIEKVLIVTMVSDYLKKYYYYQDYAKQYFSISTVVSNNTIFTTTKYNISEKEVKWDDICYSINDWNKIAEMCGYSMTYEKQKDMISEAFHIEWNELTYACSTDVCILLKKLK